MPAAVVKMNLIDNATFEKVKKNVDAKAFYPELPNYIDLDEYIKSDGYKIYQSICNGEISAEDAVSTLEDSELKA